MSPNPKSSQPHSEFLAKLKYEVNWMYEDLMENADWLSRISLAIVYIWFGLLKMLNISPIADVVIDLYSRLLPGVDPVLLFLLLGSVEFVLGIFLLLPRCTNWVVTLVMLHLFGTFMTLFVLPEQAWSNTLLPTLLGEFVIKNVVFVAMGIQLLSNRYHHQKHR